MFHSGYKRRTIDNKSVLILTGLLMFTLLFLACRGDESDADAGQMGNQLFTCGMHPEVIEDEPGICPICKMKLTPLKQMTGTTIAENQSSDQEEVSGESRQISINGDNQKKILYWRAPMDPTYISDKPGKSPMGMDLLPVYEGEEVSSGSTITIDPITVQNIGVRTAEVKRQPFSRVIRTVGHIDYNEEALYNINIKFPGWVEKLHADRTGDQVRKGQRLFEIYAPDLVATQEEYLLAHKNRRKLTESKFSEVSSGAERLLQATRQRLKFWDISDEGIRTLEQTGEVSKTLTIYSPATGIIVDKNVIEGGYIKEGMDLFRIADLSTVWVYAHIFEYEVPWIKVGQKVDMELPYVPGRKFEGRVDYIYPYLDSKTRDVKIRLVFENPNMELKPQMYANITINSMLEDDALVIPSEAILRTGKRNLVFIDLGNGKFRPQDVIIGPEGEDALVQVIAGLNQGQRIVTSAQFLLDSESRLSEAIQKMLEAKKNTAAKSLQPESEMQSQDAPQHEMQGQEQKTETEHQH